MPTVVETIRMVADGGSAVETISVGVRGDTGATGAQGPRGESSAFVMTWDALTADADPGPGEIRLNHATLASVTTAYLDNLTAAGASIASWLDSFDDVGSSVLRGTLLLKKIGAPANYALYNVTGSVVDGTGYRKVTLAHISSAGSFAAADEIAISFSPAGVSAPSLLLWGDDMVASKTLPSLSEALVLAGTDEFMANVGGDPRRASFNTLAQMIAAGAIALAAGIVTADARLRISQTWNNGAVDFTAVEIDATELAAGAGSKLLDVKYGGVSAFSIRWDGVLDGIPFADGEMGLVPAPAGPLGSKFLRDDATWQTLAPEAFLGDVVGPASAADNALARFDGTTGKAIQNSGALLSDSNVLTLPSGIITTSQPHTITQTWNAAGVTFVGKSNEYTNTASAAGSLLERWAVGGVNKFAIGKSGQLQITADGSAGYTGSYTAAVRFSHGATDYPSFGIAFYDDTFSMPYALWSYFGMNGEYATASSVTLSQKRSNVDGLIQGVSAVSDGTEPSMLAISPDVNGPSIAVESRSILTGGNNNSAAIAVYDHNDIHGGTGPYSGGYGRKKWQIDGKGRQWWGIDLSNDAPTNYQTTLEHVPTASSRAGLRLTANTTSAFFDFYETNATAGNRNWRIATNYSGAGYFEILKSASQGAAPGTSVVTIDSDGAIGIGAAPLFKLDVQGTKNTIGIRVSSNVANDVLFYGTGTVTGTLNVFLSNISATADVRSLFANSRNTALAHASLVIEVGGASAGDPRIQFQVPGASTNWNLGVDNANSDRFKLSNNGNGLVGDNALLTVEVGGNVGIGEAVPDYRLDVNGTFGFTPGASVTPVDNGDVVFELTNNTTLTVKAKGSDATVRSGTITLA